MTVTGRSDAGRGIRRAGILLMFALLIMPGTAYAHGGDVLTRDQVLRTWTWSPVIFGGLVLFVGLLLLMWGVFPQAVPFAPVEWLSAHLGGM